MKGQNFGIPSRACRGQAEVPLLTGVLTQLKNRGAQDILVARTGGLSGFPGALRAVYPQTMIQLCVARTAGLSVKFVSRKGLKKLCADLKRIYSAGGGEAGLGAPEGLGGKRNGKHPMIYRSRQRHWNGLSGFFKYPPETRKAVYTANAVESLNYSLRKAVKNKLTFVNDDVIFKIVYLAIRNASEKWAVPVRGWGQALNRFAVEFGKERVLFL
jgi:transposase-like protein